MAFSICCRASPSWSIVSATTLRRRLPLVGAFCMLSFGLSNLCLSYSSSLKTGCAQSLPFAPLLRYPPLSLWLCDIYVVGFIDFIQIWQPFLCNCVSDRSLLGNRQPRTSIVSEWKGVATLCQVSSSMLPFLTKNWVCLWILFHYGNEMNFHHRLHQSSITKFLSSEFWSNFVLGVNLFSC